MTPRKQAEMYETAEANYLAAVRLHSPDVNLGELAHAVATAADSWQASAYREFFDARDRFSETDRAVIQLEIEAEVAEALHGLWTDLATAHLPE